MNGTSNAPLGKPAAPSGDALAQAEELSCGEMIHRVLAGDDLAGRVVFVTGIALNATEGGLVNVGTPDTYRSQNFENFVSVYDVPRQVPEGADVRFLVRVETARAVTLPTAAVVLIEAKYLER